MRQIICQRHNFGTIRHQEDVLWSLGPHDVALTLHLAQRLPTHVRAFGHSYLQPHIVDTCTVALSFAATVHASISLSWLHPLKEQRLIVQGDAAAVVFDDVHKTLQLQPLAIAAAAPGGVPMAVRRAPTAVAFGPEEPLEAQGRAFIAAIASRKAPLTHGRTGAEVVRILAAAQASLRQNGRVMRLRA